MNRRENLISPMLINAIHTTHSIHMVFTEKNIRKKTHARALSVHRSSIWPHRKIMHKTQERSKNIIYSYTYTSVYTRYINGNRGEEENNNS